jgi:hypothetical protein
MKSRLIVGVLVLVGLFSVSAFATRGDAVGPDKQWAIVNFVSPVLVKGELLMGPYLIVHDSAKMARGEPCSTFYVFDKNHGPQQVAVSFHCRPVSREICDKTTLTVTNDPSGIARLDEYQIGGDLEAHGVPVK